MNLDAQVLIVGAGMSGIAAAYYLEKYGISYKIIEINEELGGTWYEQKFHGVRFDSLHIQTLFSFEPLDCDPLCEGKVFLKYLNDVAKKYGIYQNIHFDERVLRINWKDDENVWVVSTNGQDYRVQFVMNANGYYTKQPYIPEIFEKTKFRGKVIHSFHVDQDTLDLSNDDVVIIGSGATCTTMVPEVYKKAKSLTLVQRTPSWTPPGQYPFYSTFVRWYHQGWTWPWKVYRICVILSIHNFLNALFNVFRGKYSRRFLLWLLSFWMDKKLIEKHFTPKYDPGEQRLCASKGFIETIPKIQVHTGECKLVKEGVKVNDTVVEADTVLLCTGFNLDYFKFKVEQNGTPINMYEMTIRDDWLFEKMPNFCNLIAFSSLAVQNASCYTPLLERKAVFMCEMIQYMSKKGYSRADIIPTEEETELIIPMVSNYFQRNKDRCFIGVPEEQNNAASALKILGIGNSFDPKNFKFN